MIGPSRQNTSRQKSVSSEDLANTCDCKDQKNYKQHEEQAGQELRDRNRGARNGREAQDGGNDAGDEEHQRELQHGPPPSFREDQLPVPYLHSLEVVVADFVV